MVAGKEDVPKVNWRNEETQAMEDALYEAQANDAYWHGLFGGLSKKRLGL